VHVSYYLRQAGRSGVLPPGGRHRRGRQQTVPGTEDTPDTIVEPSWPVFIASEVRHFLHIATLPWRT